MGHDYEVGIIGGGPAGSSMAAYLAKAGLKCVVLERELFPRPHVGESLVPSSNRVLKEIGFIDKMDGCGFVRKYGAVWTAGGGGLYDVDFDGLSPDCQANVRFEERQQAGVDRIYTWHVDRGRFDQALLEHAHQLGAEVHEGIKVHNVDFSDPASPRINYSNGKKDQHMNVRVVVDASGRHTLLGNQLKFKKPDPIFNQYAMHAWFDGYDRLALAKKKIYGDYIFIHFLPVTNTWLWQIPVSETVTSIGVVTQKKNFEKSKQSREKFFWDAIGSRPELLEALKQSKQVRPIKDEGDYSYGMTQISGDGFVMIGDAARFVDPIFSSGVSIALTCAKFASADIIKGMEQGGPFTMNKFDDYVTLIRRGTKNWYEFISLYYRLNVLFTAFVQDPRYRLDVLALLQGDLYEETRPPVLAEMARIVNEVEQRPNHPWHKLLGDLTGDFRPLF
ncbi:MAG TPA: NAD(P)/FAD-dependent oxidoreductase [Terriglobia bacterium]|nr:NAD(P)/FAD-dependent oxidoreductase [Terriglobia bacterium]